MNRLRQIRPYSPELLRRRLAWLFGLSLLPSAAWSLGLGPLEAHSRLFEPLRASVTISGISAAEVDYLRATASFDGGEGAALDQRLQTRILESGGELRIELLTREDLREPLVGLTVQLRAPTLTISRRYDLMLDLPLPAPATAPVASVAPTASARVSRASEPVPSGADAVRVREGESLSTIAQRIADARAMSVHPVIAALYETNPDAFIGGDLHRLKQGAVLRVPDNLVARTRRLDWQTPGSPPQPTPEPRLLATGREAGPLRSVVEPAPAPTPDPVAPPRFQFAVRLSERSLRLAETASVAAAPPAPTPETGGARSAEAASVEPAVVPPAAPVRSASAPEAAEAPVVTPAAVPRRTPDVVAGGSESRFDFWWWPLVAIAALLGWLGWRRYAEGRIDEDEDYDYDAGFDDGGNAVPLPEIRMDVGSEPARVEPVAAPASVTPKRPYEQPEPVAEGRVAVPAGGIEVPTAQEENSGIDARFSTGQTLDWVIDDTWGGEPVIADAPGRTVPGKVDADWIAPDGKASDTMERTHDDNDLRFMDTVQAEDDAALHQLFGEYEEAARMLREELANGGSRSELSMRLLTNYAGSGDVPQFLELAYSLYRDRDDDPGIDWEAIDGLGRAFCPDAGLFGGPGVSAEAPYRDGVPAQADAPDPAPEASVDETPVTEPEDGRGSDSWPSAAKADDDTPAAVRASDELMTGDHTIDFDLDELGNDDRIDKVIDLRKHHASLAATGNADQRVLKTIQDMLDRGDVDSARAALDELVEQAWSRMR